MKRTIISLLVTGLFATATAAMAAEEDVKADPKAAESSQSRAGDPNAKDEMNNPSKDQRVMQEKGDAAFKKADKDNDGTLDRKEAKAMPRVAKNFNAIDTDSDGTVSLDEVHTYMAAHPGKKGDM
jgi:Ca2+-binding EF-hand superfamily protein